MSIRHLLGNTVSMEALADPVEASRDRMTPPCCPELGEKSPCLCEVELLGVDCPGQGAGLRVRRRSSAEAVLQDEGVLTPLLNCCPLRHSRHAARGAWRRRTYSGRK